MQVVETSATGVNPEPSRSSVVESEVRPQKIQKYKTKPKTPAAPVMPPPALKLTAPKPSLSHPVASTSTAKVVPPPPDSRNSETVPTYTRKGKGKGKRNSNGNKKLFD